MEMNHAHICSICGGTIDCDYTEKKCRATGTFRAVAVNGQGPVCELCRNVTMAVRICQMRKYKQTALKQLMAQIWKDENDTPSVQKSCLSRSAE